MELSKANLRWVFPAMAVAALVALHAAIPANAQIPVSPCTASMLTSFTPCMNFLTNNTANMTTPTPGCCNSLMSLASNSSGCLCQILTGGVPFQVPVNRTTAISLPRSCNMPGVPIQCNLATSPPASAPGPNPLAQTPGLSPPAAAPSASTIPTSPSPVVAPVSDTTQTITPSTSPTTNTEAPTTTTSTNSPAKTSNATTSAATPTFTLSPSLLILPLAFVMMKCY